MDSQVARGHHNEYIFSRERSRAVDEAAVSRFGIPGIVLMENAARSAAEIALAGLAVRHAGSGSGLPPVIVLQAGGLFHQPRRVMLICGSGNNGGDGLAMARHLHNAGVEVEIVMLGSPRSGSDASTNFEIARRMNLSIHEFQSRSRRGGPDTELGRADLLVDAIFGTGLDRPVEGAAADAIDRINEFEGPIMSLDLPSGLDCDSGEVLGAAVRATLTVSFLGPKRGFFTDTGRAHAGEVVVAGIGAPRELIAEFGEPRRDRGDA